MQTLQKILVPTDLSDFSLAAMELARLLANNFGASITLIYVVDNLPTLTYPLPVDFNTEKIFADALETAKMDLKLFVAEKLDDDETMARVAIIGTPYEEITRYAFDHSMDLIVIATHGRTGLRHVLLGSVAERVVRHSAVPVVTVKPAAMRIGAVVGAHEGAGATA